MSPLQTRWLKSLLLAGLIVLTAPTLSSCSSTQVYGSVGVGVSTGSAGFNAHRSSSGRRMSGSISVGGRIR